MNILYDKIKKIQEKIKANDEVIESLESEKKTNEHKLNDAYYERTYIQSLLDDKKFKDGHNLKHKSKLYIVLFAFFLISMFGLGLCVANFQVTGSSLLQIGLEVFGIIFSCIGACVVWDKHLAYEKLMSDIRYVNLTDKDNKCMITVDLSLVKNKLQIINEKIDLLNSNIEANTKEIYSYYDIKLDLIDLIKKIEKEGTCLQESMNKVIEDNMTDELKEELLKADNLLKKKVLVKERV